MIVKKAVCFVVVAAYSIILSQEEFLEKIKQAMQKIQKAKSSRANRGNFNYISKEKRKAKVRKTIIGKLANPLYKIVNSHKPIATKKNPNLNNVSQDPQISKSLNSAVKSVKKELKSRIGGIVGFGSKFENLRVPDIREIFKRSNKLETTRDKEYNSKIKFFKIPGLNKELSKEYFDELRIWLNISLKQIVVFWNAIELFLKNPALKLTCNIELEDYNLAFTNSSYSFNSYEIQKIFAPFYFPSLVSLVKMGNLDRTLYKCAGYNANNWKYGIDLCEFYKDNKYKIFTGDNYISQLAGLNAYGNCISDAKKSPPPILVDILQCLDYIYKNTQISTVTVTNVPTSCYDVINKVKELYKQFRFYFSKATKVFENIFKDYIKKSMQHINFEKQNGDLDIVNHLLYNFYREIFYKTALPLYILDTQMKCNPNGEFERIQTCNGKAFSNIFGKLKRAFLAIAKEINYPVCKGTDFLHYFSRISPEVFSRLMAKYPQEIDILFRVKYYIAGQKDFNECDMAIMSVVNFRLSKGDDNLKKMMLMPDLANGIKYIDINKMIPALHSVLSTTSQYIKGCTNNYGIFNNLYGSVNKIMENFSKYIQPIDTSDVKNSFDKSEYAPLTNFVANTYQDLLNFQEEFKKLTDTKDKLYNENLNSCEKIMLLNLFGIGEINADDMISVYKGLSENFLDKIKQVITKLNSNFASRNLSKIIEILGDINEISIYSRYVAFFIKFVFKNKMQGKCENIGIIDKLGLSTDLKEILNLAYKDMPLEEFLKKYEKQDYGYLFRLFWSFLFVDSYITSSLYNFAAYLNKSNMNDFCRNFKNFRCTEGQYPVQNFCSEKICSLDKEIADYTLLTFMNEKFSRCLNDDKCPFFNVEKLRYFTRRTECGNSCPQICNDGQCNILGFWLINTAKVLIDAKEDVISKIGVSSYIEKTNLCCQQCLFNEDERMKLYEKCEGEFVKPVEKILATQAINLENDNIIRQILCKGMNTGECNKTINSFVFTLSAGGYEKYGCGETPSPTTQSSASGGGPGLPDIPAGFVGGQK